MMEPDSRTYVWGAKDYTPAKFYKFIFAQIDCHAVIKGIWKSRCLPKLKVFLWLMYYDRLNTKNIMHRKHWNLEDGTNCILCNRGVFETRDHLFFDCPFASTCWRHIGYQWEIGRAHV